MVARRGTGGQNLRQSQSTQCQGAYLHELTPTQRAGAGGRAFSVDVHEPVLTVIDNTSL